MILLLVLLVIIFLLLIRKNKLIWSIILLLLGLICYFSKDIPDMEIYREYYDSVGKKVYTDFLGNGWKWLCIFGNYFKLDYYVFKSIIYVFSCLIVLLTIKRITKKVSMVFGIYLITIGLLDLIQIRFFLAASLGVYFLVLFLNSKRKSKYLFYLMAISLLYFIHSSMLFLLIFIIIPFNRKVDFRGIFILLSFCSLLVLMVFPSFIISVFEFVLPEYQLERITLYLNNEKVSIIGLIVYSLFYIIPLIGYEKIIKNSKKFPSTSITNISAYRLINYILLLTIPLVYMSSDFMRLNRMFIVLNMCVFVNAFYLRDLKGNLLGVKCSMKRMLKVTYISYFVLFVFIFNFKAVVLFLF